MSALRFCTEQHKIETMTQTLYERIGGKDTITKATHYLYVNIFRDEQLKPFFKDINIERQTQKMQAFLTYILGGEPSYTGSMLRDAHKHVVEQGLNDKHIDTMIDCVYATLTEMGIDNNIIGEVCQKINEYRNEVLGR